MLGQRNNVPIRRYFYWWSYWGVLDWGLALSSSEPSEALGFPCEELSWKGGSLLSWGNFKRQRGYWLLVKGCPKDPTWQLSSLHQATLGVLSELWDKETLRNSTDNLHCLQVDTKVMGSLMNICFLLSMRPSSLSVLFKPHNQSIQ